MRKILEQCPSCGGPLVISEVRCQACDTQVRSQYQPCDFCSLTQEQATFVRLFVQNRGKLNAMEELLGVSYPTVSSKLDEIIGRLQAGAARRAAALAPVAPVPPVPPIPPVPPVTLVAATPGRPVAGLTRKQVLEKLSEGAISAPDALATLKILNDQFSDEETAEIAAEVEESE
jgi:hypothetical protein